MANVHCSREELIKWRDEGAGDRDELIAHLATCAVCRAVAADVERDRLPDTSPAQLRAQDFVSRGYRVRAAAPPAGAWRRWRWVAATATLAALVFVPVWLARSGDGARVMRGEATGLMLVQPVDAVVAPDEVTFEWSGAPAGARLRLNVVNLDRPDAPLIERDVTGSRYQPSAEERARFQSGQSLHWLVELLDAGGAGTSPTSRFRVR